MIYELNVIQMKYRLLRLLLFASALAWGISIVAVFLPWSTAVDSLQSMGATAIPNDPMLNYWLRMAAGGFTFVGVIFLLIGLNPEKYRNIIGLMAILMFLEGLILLVSGLYLNLKPFPFYSDSGFCIISGLAIFYLRNAKKEILNN
jgi:FtsH-binding integral membrane protein